MCVYLRNGVLRQVERRLQQPVSRGLDHRVNHTDAKVQRPGCAAGLPERTLQIGAERKNVLCVAERDPSGVAQLQLAPALAKQLLPQPACAALISYTSIFWK